MIKRPTWIMVIVLATLAGLAYYMQTVPDNLIKKSLDAGKTPTAGVSTTALIPTTDGPISSIELTATDGRSITLKHASTTWILSADAANTDPSMVEQAASQAQNMRITNLEIKPNTADLSSFGLDKPYSYKVSMESGKIFNFKIGKTTILDNGYYLQKTDGSIAIVDKYTMDGLLTLLKQPSPIFTATPSATPAIEIPMGTITPTPAATATQGS